LPDAPTGAAASRPDTAAAPAAHPAPLAAALAEVRTAAYDVPNVIGARETRTGRTAAIVTPHEHSVRLGQVHHATAEHVEAAIDAAGAARAAWSALPFEERARPFLRAAELLEEGPWRERLNAATMLELSKTRDQAEGDASGETVEFLRANVDNARSLQTVQPHSPHGVANHLEYRPLEGFVLAISPFNFVSTNNLAFAPALLGNTVVWKPAESASLTAHLSLQLLREAGLPDGVVNMVHGSGRALGPAALTHRNLAAVHFTGSTGTFRSIFRTVGERIEHYCDYPRVVGETGGKDFVIAHPSADPEAVAVACVRGAYEYQGQKCSAPSRIYLPRSLWPRVRDRIVALTERIVVGDPTVPGTHLGAVINARQHARHTEVLAKARGEGIVVTGGTTDDSTGWFVAPTLLEVADPHSPFMTEEFFAPVMAAYVYEDAEWEDALRLVDTSTQYGLTGAVFAHDEAALARASEVLRYTAGNFYLNTKPTSAVVGQQPFGGARASGTNDKTGTVWNLIRFTSPRSVKRNLLPGPEEAWPA